MSWNVTDKYALDMSGQTDNAAKLAQLANDIAIMYGAGDPRKPLPRLVFSEGAMSFSAWPDLAYPNLQIVAEGECRLQYTGSGDGVVFDGSKRNPTAQEPGIDNLTFEGFDIYAAKQGVPLAFRGIHRSNLSARVLVWQGSANLRSAIEMTFCIVTKIHPVVSSGRANPITGLYVTAWPGKPTLQSTDCTIDMPILEGCSIGLLWDNAGSCDAHGGTIENCGVGVQLNANAGNNIHRSIEMEGNSQYDVMENVGSKKNGFEYCGNDGNLKTNFGWFSSNWSKN